MEPRKAYVKDCDLYGCNRNCGEEASEKECEFVPILIIPLHDEEALEAHVKGRLQFGNPTGADPWTDRPVDAPMQRMERQKVVVFTPVE